MKLQNKKPLIIAVIIMIASQMGTNFYFVSLPLVASYFNKPASLVLDTVYYYLLSYGLAQLVVAPFISRIGFKNTAIMGFSIFAVGIIIILLAPSLFVLIVGRSIQGFGGATMYVLIRTLIQKKYHEKETNIAFSILESFAMITPTLAPLFAASLLEFVSWKGLFYFILCYVVFAIIMINKMLDNIKIKPTPRLKSILLNYKNLLLNFNYVRFLIVILFTFTPTIFCLSSLPVILSGNFGFTPIQYSLCMSLSMCGSFLGTIFSKVANQNNTKNNAIKVAIFTMIFSGIIMKAINILNINSLILFMLSVSAIFFSFGVIFPNAVADSFKKVSHKTGAEVALLGFFQVAGSGVINFTLTRFVSNPANLLWILFIICGFCIMFAYKFES